MQRGADRGGVKMTKRLEVLIEQIPVGIDAALITGYEIIRYYTGQSVPGAWLLVSRSEACMFVSPYHRGNKEQAEDIMYVKSCDAYKALQEELKKREKKIKTLAVQVEQISVSDYEKLKKIVPCEIVADGCLDDVIYQQNCRKTEEEVRAVQAAQNVADKMFTEVLNYVHAGMNDMELQKIVGVLLRDFGSERDSYDHVTGVGVNTSMPHVRPNGTIIQPGDFVMLDVGATVDGYGSDMTRMFAIEFADDKKREIYEIVRRAQQAGCEAIEVGKPCCEVDRAARKIIEDAGYGEYYMHGLGHSIGIQVPRGPRFNQWDTTPVFSDLIMTVEPGIYLPGEFGVRIEDMLYIGEKQVQNMTHSTHELIIV